MAYMLHKWLLAVGIAEIEIFTLEELAVTFEVKNTGEEFGEPKFRDTIEFAENTPVILALPGAVFESVVTIFVLKFVRTTLTFSTS